MTANISADRKWELWTLGIRASGVGGFTDAARWRLLINNLTKLSARVTETVSLTTALGTNYDSAPPQAATGPQPVNTDVALTVGAEAASK